jgi:hypothetical protein
MPILQANCTLFAGDTCTKSGNHYILDLCTDLTLTTTLKYTSVLAFEDNTCDTATTSWSGK